jgi:hypothetical protein
MKEKLLRLTTDICDGYNCCVRSYNERPTYMDHKYRLFPATSVNKRHENDTLDFAFVLKYNNVDLVVFFFDDIIIGDIDIVFNDQIEIRKISHINAISHAYLLCHMRVEEFYRNYSHSKD